MVWFTGEKLIPGKLNVDLTQSTVRTRKQSNSDRLYLKGRIKPTIIPICYDSHCNFLFLFHYISKVHTYCCSETYKTVTLWKRGRLIDLSLNFK